MTAVTERRIPLTPDRSAGTASRDDKPDPMGAIIDVVRAAQRVVLARIDLIQVEAKQTLQSVSMFAVAAVTAAFGWVVLMAAAVAGLDQVMPLALALAIVGALHVIAGGALALSAKSRARPGQSTLSPSDAKAPASTLRSLT